MKVKIKKLHPNAVIPKQGSKLAGGWDVVATEICVQFDLAICHLGFALQPPPGYKITIVPRSSITKSHWVLQNSPCLGDEDYTGEYVLKFRCIPTLGGLSSFTGNISLYPGEEFPYKPGDRIAQMYLEEVIPIEFEEVEELSNTERGDGGFGSTGR